MKKVLQTLIFVAILTTAIFAQNLGEQTCEDGTARYACSQNYPGYMCVQSGSTNTLLNVIGEKYPLDYPKADLAGQLTDNAIKCACENFEGYIESGGECVNESTFSTNTPEPQKQQNTQIENTNSTQNEIAQKNTTEQNTTGKEVVERPQDLINKVEADMLEVPTNPVVEQKPTQNFKLSDTGIVGIIIAVSVVGAIALAILIIIGIVVAFKIRRKKNGL